MSFGTVRAILRNDDRFDQWMSAEVKAILVARVIEDLDLPAFRRRTRTSFSGAIADPEGKAHSAFEGMSIGLPDVAPGIFRMHRLHRVVQSVHPAAHLVQSVHPAVVQSVFRQIPDAPGCTTRCIRKFRMHRVVAGCTRMHHPVHPEIPDAPSGASGIKRMHQVKFRMHPDAPPGASGIAGCTGPFRLHQVVVTIFPRHYGFIIWIRTHI
jgi:hypothetical protein